MAGRFQRVTAYVLNEVQETRLARAAHVAAQVLYHTARKAREDQSAQRAAALSFFTLLNLFPLVGLLLFFLGNSTLFQNNVKAVQAALVNQLMTPAAQQVVLDLFDSLSKNLSVLGMGISGGTALAVLLLLGTSLIVLVERSLNEIWRSPSKGGPLLARISLLWMGVTLLPLLVGISLAFSAHIKEGMPRLYLTAHYLLPYFITFAAFFTLYWFTPRIRLKLGAVVLASLAGAAFWEGAKIGLSIYVRLVFSQSAVEKLYGSLALVPIGMAWIYYSWIIVLLGAELAYVLHHRQRLQEEARLKRALGEGFTPLSRRAAIALLLEVVESFESGRGAVDPLALTASYQLHPDQVERWFGALEEAGFVARTPANTILASKPARDIPVKDLAALHKDKFNAAFDTAMPKVRTWVADEEAAFIAVCGSKSLADWV